MSHRTTGQYDTDGNATVEQHAIDFRAALDDTASSLDRRDQRLDQREHATRYAISAQCKLNVRNAIERCRGMPGVAAVVRRIAAQQHPQMRITHLAVDSGSHAAQWVDGGQGARVAQSHARHRRPGRGRAEYEVRRGRLPDPAAIGQKVRQFARGRRPEGRPHVGQRLLRFVGHVEHASVGVAVAKAGVEAAQSDHVGQSQAGPGEHVGEHPGQGEHAGAGLHSDPVEFDGSGLSARSWTGFEHPHCQAAGGQGERGGQPADTGADHQHLALSHRAACCRNPAGAATGPEPPVGRSRAEGPADGCGPVGHRWRP